MLRYKRIKDFFFMDTFFATKKGGQSSRGHTCCQLFFADKGFIYVVPMKKKSEVLLAIKQFELIKRRLGTPMTHQTLTSQKLSRNMKIMNNKNSQNFKVKTLLTLLASLSTSNKHMTKLSMLKSSYNLEKKWSLAK